MSYKHISVSETFALLDKTEEELQSVSAGIEGAEDHCPMDMDERCSKQKSVKTNRLTIFQFETLSNPPTPPGMA